MGKTKPKDIGTRQETKLCNVMNDYAGSVVCERVVQRGNKDRGDLRIIVDDLVITGESKHNKVYPSESMLAEFQEQTVRENRHAGQDGGVLFVNLPNKSIQRAECWMQPKTLLLLHGIDRLVEKLETERDRELLSRFMEADVPWLRLTLLNFMELCWGKPAWGRK